MFGAVFSSECHDSWGPTVIKSQCFLDKLMLFLLFNCLLPIGPVFIIDFFSHEVKLCVNVNFLIFY